MTGQYHLRKRMDQTESLSISRCTLIHPLTRMVLTSSRFDQMATKKPVAKKSFICPAARPARMPSTIKPMLATLVDEPFSDPDWIFETKWDGFRSVCFLRNGNARFVSRNQIEMPPQYPELANIAKQVRAKEAILDGEICALDREGIPRFQMLQRKGGTQRPPIVYFVFDLLYVD